MHLSFELLRYVLSPRLDSAVYIASKIDQIVERDIVSQYLDKSLLQVTKCSTICVS